MVLTECAGSLTMAMTPSGVTNAMLVVLASAKQLVPEKQTEAAKEVRPMKPLRPP